MKDPYQILKIDKGASLLEIERAYHKNMLNYGPDPRVSYSEAERAKINEMISDIEDAFQVLSNEALEKKPAKKNQGNGKGRVDSDRNGMYGNFFGLTESPFNLTPDTKYFYLSSKHKEALAHLFFGLQEQKGFVVISGEVGTGKTILCRSFLAQIDASIKVAYIFNPCLTDVELLQCINQEFGLPSKSTSKKTLLDDFNDFLLKARRESRKVVVVIDEAQDLKIETLEQLRLLSNLETETEKLLHMVLVGQPELRDLLKDYQLRQLDQRITVRWNLSPLDLNETRSYIRHRLRIARGWGKVNFTGGAIRQIYKASKGVPRMINVLSDRALLVSYTLGKKSINRRIAYLAVSSYDKGSIPASKPIPKTGAMVVTLVLALFFSLYMGPWGGDYFKSSGISGFAEKIKKTGYLDKASAIVENVFQWVRTREVKKIPEQNILQETAKESVPEKTMAEEPVPSVKTVETEEPPEAAITVTTPGMESFENETEILDKNEYQFEEQSQLEALNSVLEMWEAPRLSDIERENFLTESIQDRGLHVYMFQGDFEQIERMDYPVVLELVSSNGKSKWYFPLSGISEGSLYAGKGKKEKFSISSIRKVWSGNGIILWKDFENLNYNLSLTDKGSQVYWLQESLEKLGFFKVRKTSYFGNLTRQAVIDFQKAHHMNPDGVVGPAMKMKLYKALGHDIPGLK